MAKTRNKDLTFLIVLHNYMLSTVPYENRLLHYSKEKEICSDPKLYIKKNQKNQKEKEKEKRKKKTLLGSRGRGGYCTENSLLYMHMFRGLGFNTSTAGVCI
ncbi:hypothetical protein M433DRAFT_543459 [Acidomyces richmondensis BFW]|nr:hypothetical protein M433DRAFT_543459 [Acidomyces richmondensis BFW]